MNDILDGARIVLSLTIMTYASWSDWKEREVSNRVWMIFAPLAFSLTTVQYVFLHQELLLVYVLSFAVTFGIATILFYVGAFGGADAKALMCLALALPYYPTDLFSHVPFFSPILPLTVFSNAVLLASLTVVYALLRNLLWRLGKGGELFEGFDNESFWRKFTVLVTGYKVELVALEKNAHVFPVEDITVKESGEEQRRLLLFPKDETQEAITARLRSAHQEGKIKDGVWVTPGLPLLIFMTAGLIIALLFGDIVWWLLRAVLLPY